MSRPLRPELPILVIDDEEAILLAVETTLQMAGYNNVRTCRDSRLVLDDLEHQPASVILLDLNMPYLDGEALMPQINARFPQIPIIVITGRIDVETAVRSMKSGALDYIAKPLEESRLIAAIHQALRFNELHRENQALRQHLLDQRLAHPEAFAPILTQNGQMLSIFRYIESIAGTDQPVLIRGETGVGKELAARALHQVSGRKGRFVAVNVAGLDDNVFADTLFGHIKGAFTGADASRSGLIERAAGGTLFLDEIGDLNHGSQVKLLRLLQEREYMPLGQDAAVRTDARIVASTHADLWTLQKSGCFRQDLHYRLRTHRILLPPLRERKEDLSLLVDHFLHRAAQSLGRQAPPLPPELLGLLENYRFPGNVRELQAMIFDALAQHQGGPLSTSAFRSHMARTQQEAGGGLNGLHHSSQAVSFGAALPTIKQATRLLVEEALRRSGNNQSTAAAILGITQQALSKRLKTWASAEKGADVP